EVWTQGEVSFPRTRAPGHDSQKRNKGQRTRQFRARLPICKWSRCRYSILLPSSDSICELLSQVRRTKTKAVVLDIILIHAPNLAEGRAPTASLVNEKQSHMALVKGGKPGCLF